MSHRYLLIMSESWSVPLAICKLCLSVGSVPLAIMLLGDVYSSSILLGDFYSSSILLGDFYSSSILLGDFHFYLRHFLLRNLYF